RYYERTLPLDPRTWADVLEAAGQPDLAEDARSLPPRVVVDPDARQRRAREVGALREAVRALPEAPLARALDQLAGRPGDPASFAPLDRLREAQPWRRAFWRAGLRTLNYRRCFDSSGLAALRADRREVFEATHRRILDLVRSGRIDGLRIDHVDGLLEPRL